MSYGPSRIAATAALLALFVLAPAARAADSSPGVTKLSSIPERGLVSARAVGNLLYTSSMEGVSIYDITDPRAPVRIGRLRLPNAQNEDVDVGNGILLVSDDPVGGRGILHVIDVRDPRNPRRLSTYSTWVPVFELFAPRGRGGIGHTASCIQGCSYAWLAGGYGIEVVDLRNPARPRFAGRVRARPAGFTHDIQVDFQGNAWVAGDRGSAAYDVTDPTRPALVSRTNRSGRRPPWNNFIHHNTLRLSSETLLVTEEDFGENCRRAGSLQSWRLEAGIARPLDRFEVERDRSVQLACSAHYFDHAGGLVAAGYYEQGLRLIDVRNPANLTQVGYWVAGRAMAFGALFAPTDRSGSVVYVLDHSRGIDIVQLDRAALSPVTRRPAAALREPTRDALMFIDDGHDMVRPGQRLRVTIEAALVVGRAARNVAVRVEIPRALRNLRLPRGARFDRRTRTLRFKVGRLRRNGISQRFLSGRVARGARLGSVLELLGYVRAGRDQLPLDDRFVDRTRVGRRAVSVSRRPPRASAAGARGPLGPLCMLGVRPFAP